MENIEVRLYNEDDIDILSRMVYDAWIYYLQETDPMRVKTMLLEQLDNPASKIWIAFENGKPVGVAEISILESYRYDGEEAHLEIMYITDEASNYYDIHGKIMDTIFQYLREESVNYMRVDTTLENADVMMV